MQVLGSGWILPCSSSGWTLHSRCVSHGNKIHGSLIKYDCNSEHGGEKILFITWVLVIHSDNSSYINISTTLFSFRLVSAANPITWLSIELSIVEVSRLGSCSATACIQFATSLQSPPPCPSFL
jgi:hypothetical protein